MELKFIPRDKLSTFEWDRQQQKWDRPGLDRDVLQQLSRPNTLYSLFRLSIYIVLLVAAATTTIFAGRYNLWLAIPFLYFYYFLFGFWIAVAHELQHRAVFAKSLHWFTDILFFVVQSLIWYSPRHHRVSHRLHHRYTMVRGIDPETDWPKVFTSRWVYGFFWNLISRALIIGAVIDFFRTVKTLFGQVLGKKDCMMRERCTAEDTAAIRIESVAILLIHLLIAAVAIGFHRWEILIFVSTPWFIGAPIEALWHQTEHIGRPYDVNDQRLCTRSVRVSPFIKVIYWGLDDHVEHHLFPGVPSCNLPKLHRILDKDHYLPESKNMVGCWREMFAIGREKDSCPDHEYVSIWMPVE